jgi:hypothetical protein
MMMKDFGAWFNEQQAQPGAQQAEQAEQACAAQGAASGIIGGCAAPFDADAYLNVPSLVPIPFEIQDQGAPLAIKPVLLRLGAIIEPGACRVLVPEGELTPTVKDLA